MSDPITVMIVDDHEMVRRGASGYLEAQLDIEVVAEAESGEEAVRLAREHIPHVVLMDIVLPGMDGVEATRKVKDVSPRSQIIVLTSYHQDEHIFPALQAGAISYLLKDVRAGELVEAIRRVQLDPITDADIAALEALRSAYLLEVGTVGDAYALYRLSVDGPGSEVRQ